MTTTQQAIANADAHLRSANLPTYSELVQLLKETRKLGLTFDVGNAYISRAFIDKQTELRMRMRNLPAQ